MNARLLALGLAFAAGALPAPAQDKMPVPVEDDPNAPAAMRQQVESAPSPQNTPPAELDSPTTPYSQAMVAYKAGDYDKALDALKGQDPAAQTDNFIILEAAILTELKRYDEGEELLQKRIGKSFDFVNPPKDTKLIVALGDLYLHKRSYTRAMKCYDLAILAHPDDPDIKLKIIYTQIGAGFLRNAEQVASTLSPFDPKNPYDDHASYYFARAALAQATGKGAEADDDIQNARTNYGITVTNRYLKTYLQFFSTPDTNAPSGIAPSPSAKP